MVKYNYFNRAYVIFCIFFTVNAMEEESYEDVFYSISGYSSVEKESHSSYSMMREIKIKKSNITFIVPEIVNKINLIQYYNKNSLLELDPRKISTFEQYRKNDVSTKNGIALLKAICTIKKKDNNFLNELKNVNEEGGIFEPIQKSAEAIKSLAEDLPGCIGEQVNKTMEVQNAIKKTFDSLRELVTNVSKFFIQDIKINKKISIIMGFVSIIFIYKLVSIYLKKNDISPEITNNINNDFLPYLRKNDFEGDIIDALNIKEFKLKYDDLTVKWKNYSINNDSVRWAYAFFSSSAVSLISFFSKELFFASKFLFQFIVLKYKKEKEKYEEHKKAIKKEIENKLEQIKEKEISLKEEISVLANNQVTINEKKQRIQLEETALIKILDAIKFKKIIEGALIQKGISILEGDKLRLKSILEKSRKDIGEIDQKTMKEQIELLEIIRASKTGLEEELQKVISELSNKTIEMRINQLKICKEKEKLENKLKKIIEKERSAEEREKIESVIEKEREKIDSVIVEKVEKIDPVIAEKVEEKEKIGVEKRIVFKLKNLLFNKNKMSVIISSPFIFWVMLRYLKYDEKIIDFFYNIGLKTKNFMTNSSLFIFEKISLGGSKIKLSLSPLLKPAYCFSLLFFPYVLFIKLAEQYEISDLEKEFLHGGNLFTFREYISYQLKKGEEKEEEENKSKIKKNFDNESSEENLIDFSNKSYKELIEDFSLNYKIIISDKFFPDIFFDPENDFHVKLFELCMYCKSLWGDILKLKEERKEEYLNHFNNFFKYLMNECLRNPTCDLEEDDLNKLIDKIKDIINKKKYQDLQDLNKLICNIKDIITSKKCSEKLRIECNIIQGVYENYYE